MTIERNRLIMELEEHRRAINREKINLSLVDLDIDILSPVVKVCAKARADYIDCLMELANSDDGEPCSADRIANLKQHRIAYEELVCAANALETVIKRGYVDVRQS